MSAVHLALYICHLRLLSRRKRYEVTVINEIMDRLGLAAAQFTHLCLHRVLPKVT